jgi:CheY-like chemotaxis protein/HPt (histidine-containing phosphotransfer) domain-containing protein
VLVVEDDPVSRRVAVHLVQRHGYAVDTATNGQAAIDAVSAQPYALVLMDCQMPGVDGFTATAEIRRREAALGDRARRVPIIALTASNVDGDRARGLAAGMDEYLTKPLDGQRLIALLERWVPGHVTIQAEAAQPVVPFTPGTPPTPGTSPTLGTPPTPAALPLTSSAEAPGLPPIIDPAGLLGSTSTLSPQHREIVDLFLTEMPQRLAALSAAVARGDRDQAARLAHTLAGSADSLGAARLADVCAQLETFARDRRHLSLHLTEKLAAVRRELHQLQTALAGAHAL